MAKKEKKEKKKGEAEIKLQRVYNIPLRKLTEKTPRYRKAKRAITVIKEFLARHMKAKAEDVKVGQHLNMKIWERSMKNIPHHVKVDVTKDADGKVFAELVGAPVEEKKGKPEKEKSEKEKTERSASADAGAEKKTEEKLEKVEEEHIEKASKAKKIEKDELNLLKHQQHQKKEKITPSVNPEKRTEKISDNPLSR